VIEQFKAAFFAVFFLLLQGFIIVSGAEAHPHLFITARYTIVFDDSGVTAIEVFWSFDEMYSSMTVTDFDKNGNGRLDKEESAELIRLGQKNLPKNDFFTHIDSDGTPFPVKSVTDFNVSMQNGMLRYSFRIPCRMPIGKEERILKISPYDAEFFAALLFAEQNPLAIKNGENFQVKTEIGEDPAIRIYFDSIHPWCLTLTCKRKI